jgi:hypothetical protein
MVNVTSLCTQCVQVITNPICPNCFMKQVLYWLRDKSLSKEELKCAITGFAELMKEVEENGSEIDCIVCSARKVNLCTFCFTNKATKILEKALKKEGVLENFKEDFETIIWRR